MLFFIVQIVILFAYLMLNNIPSFSNSFEGVLAVILKSFFHIGFNDRSNLQIKKSNPKIMYVVLVYLYED